MICFINKKESDRCTCLISDFFQIVDMETGNSVGPNVDGELCVRGPIVTKVSFPTQLLWITFTGTVKIMITSLTMRTGYIRHCFMGTVV